MPSEAELLTAQLARMKSLVKHLEINCGTTPETRSLFQILLYEIAEARERARVLEIRHRRLD